MTRAGDKVPFPMPQSGVISDQHPFAIGHGGLSLSQNWWNHDGSFRTRNGLLPLDPPKRWYEQLEIGANLVPDELAEGSTAGLSYLNYDASVTVAEGSIDAIAGDHQYVVTPASSPVSDVVTDEITASPGLPYTGWVFVSPLISAAAMEFVDSDSAVLSSETMSGDAIDQGLFSITAHSPQTTAAIQFRITPDDTEESSFGPLKLVQGEEIVAWSAGDGYAGTTGTNLFAMDVAHPETTQDAITMWDVIEGRESPASYQGQKIGGLFDDYSQVPFAGRALAYSAQPSQISPSFEEITGLELKSDYRAAVTAYSTYKMSASFFFDVENVPLFDMLYDIEAVFYNAVGEEVGTQAIASSDITALEITTPRGRDEATFQVPGLVEKLGIRIKCMCPTAKREIVYDGDSNIVYDIDGNIVTVEAGNSEAKRVGIILEDVKLVASGDAGARWWDFELPTVSHSGPYDESEYPLNYYPHDYLFEGATESNRIVMASDKSLWKWDDTADEWLQVGFDLNTIYSRFYLTGENEDEDETYTLDERIVFEEDEPEGYTSDGTVDEPDELEFEVWLPSAGIDSTSPAPGQSWRYRINEGSWSDTYSLKSEDSPVTETLVKINGRTLPVKIKLTLEDWDDDAGRWTDFDDVCVIPEDWSEENEDPFEDPIFKARIYTRRHDDQAGETLFNTDRDGPVDMRGYDFSQKTWVICANPSDRVTAWDGQIGTKVERAGSNAPFARTVCVSGGRVLAGNVTFDDPGTDFVAPLAVVYSDTFLSRGFRNWHPELAIRLADTPGEVVKLLEMGKLSVTAYKTDALYMLVYQTGNNPFRTQLMASNIPGPVSVRGVAAMSKSNHLYLGVDGGIYIFDGTQPRNFSQNISRTIQYELDLSYKDRTFLAYSPRLNSVFAMYPTKGSDGRVNRGMWIDIEQQAGWPFEWNDPLFDFTAGTPVQTVESYEMGGVTVRLGGVTTALAAGQSLQPDFFMGALDGSTYVMDEAAQNDLGNPVRALLRSGLTEFGLMDRYSLLKEMEFIVNRTNTPHTLEVEVWASDHGTDARPVAHADIDIFEDGPYSAEIREKARYFGYGLTIDAMEQISVSGAFGSVMGLGRRKS